MYYVGSINNEWVVWELIEISMLHADHVIRRIPEPTRSAVNDVWIEHGADGVPDPFRAGTRSPSKKQGIDTLPELGVVIV